MNNTFNLRLCSYAYEVISFKLGLMLETCKLYNSEMIDLDIHPWSEGCKKAGTCAIVLLKNGVK